MTETIICGTTVIAVETITRLPGENRRQAERRTAIEALRRLTGDPDATTGHNDDGSPFVANRPDLHLSISHSLNLAAVAVDPCRAVGIDIEENRTGQLQRVAARILSPDELEYYSSLPGGLLAAWTMKEALFKVAPAGTADDFRRDIALPLAPHCDRARAGGREYSIALSAARPGYRLTLAVTRDASESPLDQL